MDGVIDEARTVVRQRESDHDALHVRRRALVFGFELAAAVLGRSSMLEAASG
jgi:hypothetical protein